MRIEDYVEEINKNHQDIYQLEKRIEFLENENTRLNTVITDKIIDIEMEISIIKRKMQIKEGKQ